MEQVGRQDNPEQLMREGHHIFPIDSKGYSYFDEELGKFCFIYPIEYEDDKFHTRRLSFNTFTELASWLAFVGCDHAKFPANG